MKWLLATLIVTLAVILRFWNLSSIDYTSDELHYASDAFRYYQHDPYMSVRHHPFHHPAPSVGHPFLQPLLTSYVFDVFGQQIDVPRLVPALAGVATVIALLFLTGVFPTKAAYLSAFLFAILPFSIRFSRDGHLDSLFTFFITSSVVILLLFIKRKRRLLLILLGICNAFAMSTKLDGIICLVLSSVIFLIITFHFRKEFNLKEFIINSLAIAIPFALMFFLLNDPASYINGILAPADPVYSIHTLSFWLRPFSLGDYWTNVFATLLSPALLLLDLIALGFFVYKRSLVSGILIIWQILLLPLVFLHGPGVSGEYGLLPIAPAVTAIVGYFLIRNKKHWMLTLVISLFVLIYGIGYGLKLREIPYFHSYDLLQGDDFYTSVIETVNQLAPKGGKIYLYPQTEYPIFALRSDLSWSYFGDLQSFDILVTGDSIDRQITDKRFKLIDTFTTSEYGSKTSRQIYKKVILTEKK